MIANDMISRAEFSSALGLAYDDKKKEAAACAFGGINLEELHKGVGFDLTTGAGGSAGMINTGAGAIGGNCLSGVTTGRFTAGGSVANHAEDAMQYGSAITGKSANSLFIDDNVSVYDDSEWFGSAKKAKADKEWHANPKAIEPTQTPKFKKYTEKWPLGVPGSFYNSMGDHKQISGMKSSYIKSTMKWLDKTFDFELDEHDYAYTKYQEMDDEIDTRESADRKAHADQDRLAKQQKQAQNRDRVMNSIQVKRSKDYSW